MLDETQRQLVTNRLKSVEGHVRGISKMVEEESYCIDILHQIKAVQKALDQVAAITLKNHLHTCVTSAIRSKNTDDKERVVDEVMQLFKATSKL